MDDYGLRVRLRQEMGQDIAAVRRVALVTPPSAASTGRRFHRAAFPGTGTGTGTARQAPQRISKNSCLLRTA